MHEPAPSHSQMQSNMQPQRRLTKEDAYAQAVRNGSPLLPHNCFLGHRKRMADAALGGGVATQREHLGIKAGGKVVLQVALATAVEVQQWKAGREVAPRAYG